MMTHERRAVLLMLAFVVLWALVEALAARVHKQYSPYQVVWTRYAVHLAFMLAVWGWREPATLWRTRRPAYQIARSFLMLGMPACWIIGTQIGVDPGALMTIFWLSPLIILALARLVLREPVDRWLWLAGAASSLGAALFFGSGTLPSALGALFPLGMALCFSGYVLMTRPLRHETTRANLFYTALGVFLALSPAMPAIWVTPDLHDGAILAGVGLLGWACLYALDRAAAAAPVSVSAPIAAMQVAFTALAGYWLAHTLPDGNALLGLLLIVTVTLFLWARSSSRSPSLAHPDAA